MKTTFAISRFVAAKRHLANHRRYRMWALYGAVLTGIMHVTWLLPFDLDTYYVTFEHRWIWWLNATSWWTGLALCAGLGLVGLMRSSWFGRVLSLYALWFVLFNLGPVWSDRIGRLWDGFMWHAFGAPGMWIEDVTRGNPMETGVLWVVYLAAIAFALRPGVKRAWAELRKSERRLVVIWPWTRRLTTPIIGHPHSDWP